MPEKRSKPAARPAARKPAPRKVVVKPPAPGKGGYMLEDQIGFRLRRAHQRASEIFARVMEEFALTPMQFAAMAKLDDEGPISQNHLGRLTAMDPATILGVVGRLARQGLVAVRPDPGDGRATLLSLTPAGAQQMVAMKAAGAKVSRETLAPLTPAESATLMALLARIG